MFEPLTNLTEVLLALLCFYTVFIARPVPPYTGIVATLDTPLIVATALLWFQQQRRQHALL
jgi:hypothetical protein